MSHLLALSMGLASIGLYTAAFFFPSFYRKNDLIWSGVGFFYALVLWFCAPRITGGVLLGQIASVALLGFLGWEAIQFRWQTLPAEQRALLEEGSPARTQIDKVRSAVQSLLQTAGTQATQVATQVASKASSKTTANAPSTRSSSVPAPIATPPDRSAPQPPT